MNSFNWTEACERSVMLASNGIKKLRKIDVMRVMEDFQTLPHCNMQVMVDYIAEHRPDLADEARECKVEIEAS